MQGLQGPVFDEGKLPAGQDLQKVELGLSVNLPDVQGKQLRLPNVFVLRNKPTGQVSHVRVRPSVLLTKVSGGH